MKRMLFRKFRKRKIQTVGIILITVLWMFISSFSVNLYLTNQDFRNYYFDKSNIEDFQFIPEQNIDVNSLAAKYKFNYEIQYISDFEDEGIKYRVLSDMKEIDKPYIMEGGKISAPNEILVNYEYAQANDIQVGDSLDIGQFDYKVVGIVSIPNYINMHVRNDALNYDKENEAILIAMKETVLNIKGADTFCQYSARFEEELSDDNQNNILRDMVLSREYISVTSRSDNTSISALDGKISIYFLLTIISLCVLSVIIIILLIMFIFILINEDRKNIGILIANGMKKAKIFRDYLIAVIAVLIPSAAVGYLIGYGCSPILNAHLQADISLPEINFEFKIIYFCIFMLIAFWVGLLSTLCGTVGILKKNVIELVKNNKIKKVSKLERVIQKVYRTNKIEKRVKISFALRNKLLLVLVLFSIFAAGVQFFLSYSIYQLPANIKSAQSESMNFESQVYFNNIAEKISEGDQYFYSANAIAKNNNEENIIQLYALEPGSLLKIGEKNDIGEGQVIINKTTAEILRAKEGDVITISVYDSNIELKIQSVCDRIAGKEAFVDYDYLLKQKVIENVYNGMFTSKHKNNIRSDETIQSVISAEEIIKNYENSQKVMEYGAIILFVLGIAIPIILISVTASILISENQREINIFKANGIEEKMLNKLVYGSYNSFLVIGLVISIPYSYLILNIIFSIAVKSSGIKYPVEINIISIAFAVIMTLIVYFGTMFVLRKRNKSRINLKDDL